MAKSLQDYIDEKERKQTASSSSSEEKNQGGFWGGAEYLGTRLVDGLVSNVEGIVDFTVGGLADLFGADEFAERQFADDWYNYNRADEKYNPGKGMSVAGNIAGVVGGALPDIGIGLLTGGAGLGAKIIGKGISLGTSFASSAGRGVSEAVKKTEKLGGKEWAGGLGSGGLAAGIEAASGGLGDLFGGVFGKTGVEMGSELAESFGKKASTETVGSIFGKIAGKEAAGEVSEGAGKKLISKLWNSKFGKELLGEMASEGIEEGLEAWIEPEIIQGTYDPTRPNATIGDIAYSAMLGGLGGGLISGGLGGISGAVNKTRLTTRGGTISNDSTKLNNLMHNAEVIANYENNKHTGSQIFSQVESLYNDVKASLEKNGGKVTLATMENIGRLDALVAASTVQPSIVNAAKGIAKNAESMAAALNNFYSRNGQSSNITAEQLTAGLKLKGTSQEFVASVTDALNTNPIFRQVVMNNMLGNMEFDAQSYARSIYGDMDIRNIATQQNLNRFLSTADAATLGKAGEALGITDWSRVTPEELAQRIYDYRDSGRAELTREGISAVRKAKEAKGYTNGMPTSLSALTEGATRFQSPGADFAIVRHGNSYRLYDYETGKITNAMSEGDMAALVQRIKDRQAEIGRQSEMQALDRELDNFANENVPEYKKLSEGEKEAVRATLRYARANGISLKDQILFARIAAKSGMNIIVKQKLEDGKPAWFDGVNSIYLDANAPRTRGFKGLLGHEMFHKLFQNDPDRKLFKKAYDAVPEAKRDEIEARYTDMYEKLNVHSEQEIQDISSEEVAAAYAEEIFNTPDVWSYILDGEPSIKDKVLAFFGKAPERYDFAKEMEPAAREWLQEYKQLFDSVAEYNAGGMLTSDVGVNKATGKVVDDNTAENANKKSASGTKAQDSGERFALAEEDFYASGEEFASPTISTVGKDRVNYEERFGSKEWRKTKSESAYIHAVDEMYGIQSYLEKVGKSKNAKATIQNVRSTPHMVQTMVGSVQYNVFHSESKTARKMGDGLNVIWKPIKKMGAKAEIDFNDYLLHYLNVDKYGVMERVKKGDQDAAESLGKVREEIDNLENQRSFQERRIFELGNSSKDMIIKKGIQNTLEKIDKRLVQLRSDEIALVGEAPGYAESELKKVRNEIASLLSEKERAKAEIFTLGSDESSVNRKAELKDRMAEIDKKIKRLSESAATMEEIAKSYKLAIKPVFSLDGETIGKKQSEAIIKKYEEQYPEFKAAAEKIWKFSKNLNEMRVSAGLVSQSMATRLATMYPHYVPSFKAKINNAAKGDEGVAVSSTVKKAKGYNSNIMDVKESLATQVSQVIRNGNINMLAAKVYDTAVKTGDAKYVDIKLPDIEGADLSTEGIERPKPHAIKFFKDGKPFEMNVSDEIYQGFKGISEQSAPRTNVFARATNKISNLYKKLVTSLSPAFMIRNAIRDIQDAGLNSKHPALFVKNIPLAWSELVKNSKSWQTYRAYGGFSSTVFDSKGISNEVGERGFEILGISERIASGKGLSIQDAKYIKSLLTGVENLNAVVEQIPRFAEYLSSIEAGETIEQAVYNSAEVTTNFARRGATTKAFNSTIIPFLNPAIQGFDKIFRNFTDATKAGSGKEVAKALSALLCKAIMIGIVPMMFNSIMYSDDEDYEDLREEDKENNYLIKLPNGTFIKLPRGRVASVIGGLYNRAARTVTGKDADWGGYLSNVVSQVTPAENLTRTVFSPFVDVATNRTWYGTEIEGRQFENVRPGDRYDESTSSIAIAIGKAINYSPKKIHYLIDQYSGVIGDFLLPATTKKAEKDFFSGNFTIDPVTNNKISNKFYEIYDEAQYTKTDGEVKAQYQVKYLNRVKSAVSDMYKEINAIQNSNISNYEKLQQVRVIRILINEAMKNAISDYDEINKAIDKTANMGFDDSKPGDVAIRYAYIIREVYGAEKALSEYNDDVYSKMSLLNSADISYDVLFDYYFSTKNITADVDENGKTVSGSKRGKVIAAISDMDISDEEKLLLIATQGYALKDDDIYGMSKEKSDELLFDYIASLDLSDEERLALYKYAGYDVKDGEVSGSAASGSSGSATSGSSGSSKKSFSGSLANPSGILYKATKNRARRIGKIV